MTSIPNFFQFVQDARFNSKDPGIYKPIDLKFQILAVKPAKYEYDPWDNPDCPAVVFSINEKIYMYSTYDDSWSWNYGEGCEEDTKEITIDEFNKLKLEKGWEVCPI